MARILIVAHGHPDISVGGGEKAAYDEFNELACAWRGHDCTFLFPRPIGDDPREVGQWLLPHAGRPKELSFGLATGARGYSLFDDRWDLPPELKNELAGLVERLCPDIVHVHHYYHISIDLIVHLRQLLPDARFVMTLHDYKAVCPTGYLLKSANLGLVGDERRCYGPSIEGCTACSRATAADIRRRSEGYVQMFDALDLIVAPNGFLAERFAGAYDQLPPVVQLDYGYAATVADVPEATPGLEQRFGFFGRAIPEKGMDSLLAAYELVLGRRKLRMHVSSPGITGESVTARHPRLRDPITEGYLTLADCDRPADVRRRIQSVGWVVVPSLWWENSPLVIQDAFMLGRPVICAAGGALAEKVIDGVNGLTYSVGDSEDLAEKLVEAANWDTWSSLSTGVSVPCAIGVHCSELELAYGLAR